MKVTNHSVENYIIRILELDEPEQAADGVWERAKSEIEEAANDPDIIYQVEDDSCPIHIKDRIAVPVARERDGTKYVPTTYPAENFVEVKKGK